MKKLALGFALGASLFSFSAFGASWSGTISDANCAAKHADASDKSKACVQKCVKGGAAPVFISDGKVLKISDDSKEKVMSHLGDKVTLTGKLVGDTITVDSVKM
jgi:hypothetical protein